MLKVRDIKKEYQGKQILDIESIQIHKGNKIGFIGRNGVGKSTLLDILSNVHTTHMTLSYFKQFDEVTNAEPLQLNKWEVKDLINQDDISGGEQTRSRLASALTNDASLYFFDEPTANLDDDGIQRLCVELHKLTTFVLVSHDRYVLNETCNMIWELRDTKLYVYKGNYDEYKSVRDIEVKNQLREYQEYKKEEKHLKEVHRKQVERAQKATRVPKGMSKHTYRMTNFMSGRSASEKQKNLHQKAKATSSRLEHLEIKQKPKDNSSIQFDFSLLDSVRNTNVISTEHFSFAYEKEIFSDASFVVKNGEHIAIVGGNGSGKTTLLKSIYEKHVSLFIAPSVKFAYLTQDSKELDAHKSVLENAMQDSFQEEYVVRSLLNHLLFTRDTIDKQVSYLSGGEKVKLQLVKLLVSDCNVLLMDEPTNFLDIDSLLALQEILKEYKGTILFTSHDKTFVEEVATQLFIVKDKKILIEECTSNEYTKEKVIPSIKKDIKVEKMMVEMEFARLQAKRNEFPNDEKIKQQYLEVFEKLKKLSS